MADIGALALHPPGVIGLVGNALVQGHVALDGSPNFFSRVSMATTEALNIRLQEFDVLAARRPVVPQGPERELRIEVLPDVPVLPVERVEDDPGAGPGRADVVRDHAPDLVGVPVVAQLVRRGRLRAGARRTGRPCRPGSSQSIVPATNLMLSISSFGQSLRICQQ